MSLLGVLFVCDSLSRPRQAVSAVVGGWRPRVRAFSTMNKQTANMCACVCVCSYIYYANAVHCTNVTLLCIPCIIYGIISGPSARAPFVLLVNGRILFVCNPPHPSVSTQPPSSQCVPFPPPFWRGPRAPHVRGHMVA